MYSFVWRRVMEKCFKQYVGKHYTMAFFYKDTMASDLDKLEESWCAGCGFLSTGYHDTPPHTPGWKPRPVGGIVIRSGAGAQNNKLPIGETTQKHVPLIPVPPLCATCGWRQVMYVFVCVRRVMEKSFKQYVGEHYTMAFFYQDTMVSDLDKCEES